MQDQRFRRVPAIHPHWTGGLILSALDNTVVHETHGSRGTYRLADGVLLVAWNQYPTEEFIESDGVFVHRSLVPPTSKAVVRSGSAATPPVRHPIQVVSLLRTPARRERFAALNAGIDYAFFDAVDGRTVEPGAFFGPLAEPGVPYTPGAIGCALSHLALWERSIREQSVLTIVEDDTILRSDFAAKSSEVIAGLPADWDLIMWGWNFDALLSINLMPGVSPAVLLCDQDSLRRSIATFRSVPLEVRPYRLDRSFGTCGYSISPTGSAKFKTGCFPIKNEPVHFPQFVQPMPSNGIDIAMNRLYPLTNSYVCVPPLVITPNFNAESLTLAGV